MNIDYALPATSAVARRLICLSGLSDLKISQRLITLAKQGMVPVSDALVPLSKIEQAATQFIIDCDLRCGVSDCGGQISVDVILNAIALSGATPLTIISSKHKQKSWSNALRNFKCFPDAVNYNFEEGLQIENQNGRRDGVLLVDYMMAAPTYSAAITTLTALAREFSRIIVYWNQNSHSAVAWEEVAMSLYPSMPSDNFDGAERAVYYNVFMPNALLPYGYYVDGMTDVI